MRCKTLLVLASLSRPQRLSAAACQVCDTRSRRTLLPLGARGAKDMQDVGEDP